MASSKTPKVGVVMKEFKSGNLRSGSDKGPTVTNPKQAIAIALSEARKSGEPVKRAPVSSMAELRARAKKATSGA